ncbi:MAG: cation:proton antiporter [Bacteroidetes bacterium]|nr:cation:proton antiporter [Bacteroidota bacterium]
MNIFFQIGVLLITGMILGGLAEKLRLPKISGYIIAGIVLHPQVTGFIQPGFIRQTEPLINIALAFITFSIGGTLSFERIRRTGKVILTITLFESIFAYLFVFIVMLVTLRIINPHAESWSALVVMSLVLGSLAAPTDPSATLAVTQEYKAKGDVSSAILGVAAFDDIMGILLYTLTLSFAGVYLGADGAGMGNSFMELGIEIGGALLTGVIFGFLFNRISLIFKKETEGALIVIVLSMISLCYGTAVWLGFDELLGTMAMGMIVVNFHPLQQRVFSIIERYTDELVFVVFFTLSGLHLQFTALSGSLVFIAFFVVARALGKYSGTGLASRMTHATENVRKYTAGGLFPQGGIVIGLALLLAKQEEMANFSSFVISIVIGAAIIHELIGPIFARMSLSKAGEIK